MAAGRSPGRKGLKASKSVRVADILGELERRAPAGTAEDWDNVGLLVGDPASRVSGAVVSIDLTDLAIDEAASRGYRLIVTHHPCIFPRSRGLAKVTAGHVAYRAARMGISVIASHTNFDQCAMEVVENVSKGLGARPVGRLIEAGSEPVLTKLVTFVPRAHADQVREAVCAAGAGRIANYDQCAFGAEGEGTFRGDEGTDPFIGRPGTLERAREIRLETIFPNGLRSQVIRALLEAHPYEEVAYDLYPVAQRPAPRGLVRGLGYGFIGEFPRPRSFSDLAQDVKSLFKLDGFWVTHPQPTKVKKVAFVAGKGSSFLSAAQAAGCELFVTGEVGYHGSLDGKRRGVGVLELGHRESERFFTLTMGDWLRAIGLRVALMDEPTQRIWTAGGKK